jgi:hypothetical protein
MCPKGAQGLAEDFEKNTHEGFLIQ